MYNILAYKIINLYRLNKILLLNYNLTETQEYGRAYKKINQVTIQPALSFKKSIL